MTFEEETRQLFSNLIERMNRIEAIVAHNKPMEAPEPAFSNLKLEDSLKLGVSKLEAALEAQAASHRTLLELTEAFANGK